MSSLKAAGAGAGLAFGGWCIYLAGVAATQDTCDPDYYTQVGCDRIYKFYWFVAIYLLGVIVFTGVCVAQPGGKNLFERSRGAMIGLTAVGTYLLIEVINTWLYAPPALAVSAKSVVGTSKVNTDSKGDRSNALVAGALIASVAQLIIMLGAGVELPSSSAPSGPREWPLLGIVAAQAVFWCIYLGGLSATQNDADPGVFGDSLANRYFKFEWFALVFQLIFLLGCAVVGFNKSLFVRSRGAIIGLAAVATYLFIQITDAYLYTAPDTDDTTVKSRPKALFAGAIMLSFSNILIILVAGCKPYQPGKDYGGKDLTINVGTISV